MKHSKTGRLVVPTAIALLGLFIILREPHDSVRIRATGYPMRIPTKPHLLRVHDIEERHPTALPRASSTKDEASLSEERPVFGYDGRLTYSAIEQLGLNADGSLRVQNVCDAFISVFAGVAAERIAFDEEHFDIENGVSAFVIDPFPAAAKDSFQGLSEELESAVGVQKSCFIVDSLIEHGAYPGWGESRLKVRLEELRGAMLSGDNGVRIDIDQLDPDTNKVVSKHTYILDTRQGMYADDSGILGKLFEIAPPGS